MCDSVYVNLQTFLHTMCANARQMILANSYGHKLDYGDINSMFAWVGKSLIQNRRATGIKVINACLVKLIIGIKIETLAEH